MGDTGNRNNEESLSSSGDEESSSGDDLDEWAAAMDATASSTFPLGKLQFELILRILQHVGTKFGALIFTCKCMLRAVDAIVRKRSAQRLTDLLGTPLGCKVEAALREQIGQTSTSDAYKKQFRLIFSNTKIVLKQAEPGNVVVQLHDGRLSPSEFAALRSEQFRTSAELKVREAAQAQGLLDAMTPKCAGFLTEEYPCPNCGARKAHSWLLRRKRKVDRGRLHLRCEECTTVWEVA